MIDLLQRCSTLPQRQVRAGETLIAEGEPSGALYVLIDGALEVNKRGTRVAAINEPGACIGEMGLLLGIPATADVVAIADSRLYVASDGASLLNNDPVAAVHVARLLAGRLNLVTTYLADLQQQYGGAGGSLAVIDTVLSSLMRQTGTAAQPGSARDPDPLY